MRVVWNRGNVTCGKSTSGWCLGFWQRRAFVGGAPRFGMPWNERDGNLGCRRPPGVAVSLAGNGGLGGRDVAFGLCGLHNGG